jgi:UDP-3-O-acyl-N-acetylglucosamine deacetylase
MPQRKTLVAQTAPISGRGLFSGTESTIIIAPAARGGIVFRRRDLSGQPEVSATVNNLVTDPTEIGLPRGFPARNTMLCDPQEKSCFIMTVEHVMSALAGIGVTDAVVVIDGIEVPILDGGAAAFAEHVLHCGLGAVGFVEPMIIDREFVVEDGRGGKIVAQPTTEACSQFVYELDYGPGAPIEAHRAEWFGDPGVYYGQIAPARTFCLESEANAMRQAGMFEHFTPSDLLVIGDNGVPLDNAFRFHDEPARHKLLDLIGDLALIGRPISGVVHASKSGHALTHRLSRALLSAYGEESFGVQ